jgi:hypothetical protein
MIYLHGGGSRRVADIAKTSYISLGVPISSDLRFPSLLVVSVAVWKRRWYVFPISHDLETEREMMKLQLRSGVHP